jgi:ABC-2 type transport system ATP-binding protein
VGRGEIVGLLGPNGAGKSSALLALIGIVPAEAGEVRLGGEASAPGEARLRERIGVVFQHPALDPRLTAVENLRLAGRLQGLRGEALRRRVAVALAMADIPGREAEPVTKLSGGMRRRIEVARALLHEPELLLLDEPTTGLDQASYLRGWEVLRERAEAGLGALLTTHRPDEAERCDRLAVLHEGAIVATESPESLRSRVGGDVLELEVDDPEAAASAVGAALDVEPEVHGELVRCVAERGHELVPRIVEALPAGALRSVTVHRPDLADAYLLLTGHGLGEEAS